MGPYTILDDDNYDRSTLVGPGGFECSLMEPEDRTWYRDGAPVVELLNQQHAEIVLLRAEIGKLQAQKKG